MNPARDPSAPPRVVVVARVAPEKGHLVLLDALRMLHDDGLPAVLHVVGPTEAVTAAHLERRTDELGLAGSVLIEGPASPEDVQARLRAADVFCLPSFAEGLPVSIMEAMAAGVPVVATNVAGVAELVVDEETGLLVRPGRADLLADAIARMLRERDLVDRVVAAARDRVAAEHDIDKSTAQLRALFETHAARC